MTVLTKSVCVMDAFFDEPLETGEMVFAYLDEETDKVLRDITIGVNDWVDMGKPRKITVTIEPGDLLNDENEE